MIGAGERAWRRGLECQPAEMQLLDFADVELIDTVMMGLIDDARVVLDAGGGSIRIVASGQPLHLLQITGMDAKLEIVVCRTRTERTAPAPS